jgi:hypothetical protein
VRWSVVSVSGIRRLLVRGPRLEREEPKGTNVKDRKDGEYAPKRVMTRPTKELYHWDKNKKDRNEQRNKEVQG